MSMSAAGNKDGEPTLDFLAAESKQWHAWEKENISRETLPQKIPHEEYNNDEIDAPAALLERMRAAASARGEGRLNAHSAKKIMREFGAAMNRQAGPKKKSYRSQGWDPRVMGGYTGPAESTRDPKTVDGIVGQMIISRGWREPVAVSSVIARWDELVGAELAAHTRPKKFENAIVEVHCDSTAWATQLDLMKRDIIQMFERELGSGVVHDVQIYGPRGNRWGARWTKRITGGRGVRDTYG